MTVEELEIIVDASIEPAMQKLKGMIPQIKQQVVQATQTAQKGIESINMSKVTEKVQQVVRNVKEKINTLKSSNEKNQIAININNKDAQKQISQVQKQIDSLQEKINARQLKLNMITPKLDAIAQQPMNKAIPERLENNKQYINLSDKETQLIQEIQYYNKQIDNAKSKMKELGQQISQTATTQSKMGSFFSAFKSKIEQAKPSINSLKNEFSKMPKLTQNITNNIQKMGSNIKQGVKHVLRYALALFSLRGIYSVLSNCASAWLSSQNAGAKQLSANIEYMKMAMGNALAPAIQFVTNCVYQLLKAIQSVIYALFKVNIFAGATASSMKSASNSAKSTSKSLSSVHSEINNVGDNGNGGSGTASPNIDLSKIDNNMMKWFSKWKDKLSKFFEPVKNAWNSQGQTTIDSALNMIEQINGAIISIGISFAEVWTNGTGQYTIELILMIFQNIFDIIGNIAEAWNNAWNNNGQGTELIQTMWDALNKLLELIKVLTDKIKEFTSNPIVQQYFENAIQMVTNFWKALGGLIEFLTGVFTGDWEKAWDGLKNFISGIFGLIWNIINDKLLMIKTIISNALNTIKNMWTNIWNGIKNFASNIWNGLLDKIDQIFPGIRNIIETNIANVKNNITRGLDTIKNVWNNIWSGIRTATSNIWNGIYSAIKGPINWILSGVEKMANGVVTGVNRVIKALNTVHFKMPDWLGGGTFGISLPTLGGVSLPRLAKGNVAYSETTAIFGEYAGASRNPEITAPQNIMRDTFDDVLSTHEWNNQESNGVLKTLVVQFGSTKVALEMEKLIQQARRQNGTAYATI